MLRFTPQRAYLAVCDDTGAYLQEKGRRYILVYGDQKHSWSREGIYPEVQILEKAQKALDKFTGAYVQEDF